MPHTRGLGTQKEERKQCQSVPPKRWNVRRYTIEALNAPKKKVYKNEDHMEVIL